jgi:hypothetical protein
MSAGDYAELALLHTLERGLPDAYTLFHSVDWSKGTGTHEQHGEIDIVVINQSGDVLLIEVKAGNLEFRVDGIFKTYSGQAHNVSAQIGLQYSALRSRLKDAQLAVHVNHLLVLPDVRVQSETVRWPRERIVDSSDMESIVSRTKEQIGPGSANEDLHARVVAFFENRFRVVPDVTALSGQLRDSVSRMSAGLTVWVPRISAPAGVLRVNGTAGSGKTQLALRMLRDADAAGQRAAYLCFNRALADHIARMAPVRTTAETFHEYALHVARRSGLEVDFTLPTAFETITAHCLQALTQLGPDLDLIILDEMQDMQPEWVQALLSRLKDSGRAVLLEDPEQQLYTDRVAFDIPDAVTITSHENFRTPRALVKLINLLRLTPIEVEALSPFEGDMPDPIVYASPESVQPCTVKAVERCLQRGFDIQDIAIVSMRGRERSVLQGLDQLGAWSLRHFTGKFDEGSTPIWKDGKLLIDSVRRFKGQAAPAVVLTECDIAELTPLNRRLLFVGLTRARVHLEWVISANTAKMLEQAFQP